MKRKTLGGVLIVMALMCVPGCSHNNKKAITVTIAGPTSVLVGATATYSATVNNDTAAKGVTWNCSTTGATACSSANFSSSSTASGASTTFTAPATVESVTITATSVSDTSVVATTVVSVGSGIAVTLSTAPPASMTESATTPVAATVTGDTGNGGVNWTCTTTGATACSAANFSAASTLSTVATTFTAPAGVESVTITATAVDDNTQSASATISITASTTSVITGTYTFFASGIEPDGEDTFSLAGAVTINSDGSLTGEQDFNDGDGFTFPDDQITSGNLALDPTTGLGTMTLNIPGDTSVGVNGVETLTVSFVNNNHALIMGFDASGASSGSMDLQTAPGDMTGGFAFALSGLDSDGNSVAFGGVFSLSGANITNGFFDVNDAGDVTLATTFAGTLGTEVDGFGRGTISLDSDGIALPVTIIYYGVGPEVIRIIDMDATDTALGSAYGEGANSNNYTSANAFLQSVFLIQSNSNPFNEVYSTAGQFTPVSGGGAFNAGVGDVNEEGFALLSSGITGTYLVDTDGYGNLSITNGGLEDVTSLGVYMVDTTLNINDPNNPSGGGGALVAEMDGLVGTGVIVPQAPYVEADFTGNYSFGAQIFAGSQDDFEGSQFDMLGQGTVTDGTLAGTGYFNDLFDLISTTQDNSGMIYSSTPTPDTVNPGRYGALPTALFPFDFSFGNNGPYFFDMVMYQASGGQLFLFEGDENGIAAGQLQQQTALVAAVKKAAVPKTLKK
jgi:hypothetical protein